MKSLHRISLAASCLLSFALSAADTPINLLREERFVPLRMHDRDSAAKGWGLNDPGRLGMRRTGIYVPGEECFKLEFGPEGMTFRFTDPLALPYRRVKTPLSLRAVTTSQLPPAPGYRTTGRIRFDKGKVMLLAGGPVLEPSPEWQTIDFTTRDKACFGFRFTPVAGAAYTFGSLRTEAVYPRVGGEIALPGGGKLTRLLLAEDADCLMRWSVAMWRGWLWKLTGVALPIETVKKVEPTPGAFAAIPGRTVPGGWELTVNKEGITLVYGEANAVIPALFDYLRLGFGCGFYSPDCVKAPADGSVKELAAIERKPKPKFRFITCGTPWIVCSGGWDPRTLYARNEVDYYHLPSPKWDHVLNVVMPGELYFKEHPEFFMMNRHGKRVCDTDPFRTNPCFASREGIRTMTEKLMKYTELQGFYSRITMATGDVWEHCQCPECLAFNGGRETNSDSQMLLVNEAAKAMAKRFPDKIFVHDVYATRHTVPKRVTTDARNVLFFYCLTEVVPCTLHVDCELNRKPLAEIADWNRYLGGRREQLGFMTYHDLRPLQHLRQMEYLNRLGCGEVYLFDNLGFPMSAHFTSARWNLGEDADKLMEEFDLNYYGKAGKAMHKITLLVDEYARNFRHGKEDLKGGYHHIGIWGGPPHYTLSVLTREQFDRIYRLFDEAIAAAAGDPALERRIFSEMKLYMVQDIGRYNLASCRSDAETRAFAERVARFFKMARRRPAAFEYISYGIDTVDLINNATGLRIPANAGFWAKTPAVEKFLADPVKALIVKPEKIPGGVYYSPRTIRGGASPRVYRYNCPARLCTSLTRERFGSGRGEIVLPLDKAPAAPLLLAVEGLDDDKPGTSLLEISVNGRVVFSGRNPFPEKIWGRLGVTLPADALRKGDNRIVFRNLTPDLPSRSARFADAERGATDGQWGWVALSEVYVLDPNGDFDRYKAGDVKQPWHMALATDKQPRSGGVECGGGKVVITGAPQEEIGIGYFVRGHQRPKIAAAPGSRVRIKVTAAGEGKLLMRLWNYRPQRGLPELAELPEFGYCRNTKLVRPHSTSPLFTLGAEPRTYACELVVPKEGGLIVPRVALQGAGRAEVTGVRIEIVPPAPKRP